MWFKMFLSLPGSNCHDFAARRISALGYMPSRLISAVNIDADKGDGGGSLEIYSNGKQINMKYRPRQRPSRMSRKSTEACKHCPNAIDKPSSCAAWRPTLWNRRLRCWELKRTPWKSDLKLQLKMAATANDEYSRRLQTDLEILQQKVEDLQQI